MIDDLKLDSTLAYINLSPRPHRRFKTATSERKVPFTGYWPIAMGSKASKTAVYKTIFLSSLTNQSSL